MYGLKNANDHLVGGSETRWQALAKRSTTAFLAAGGLLFGTTLLFALDALTGIATPGFLTGVTGLSGLILTYVGVAGLYPRVVNQTPRLASTGIVFVVLPVFVLLILLVWAVLGHTLSVVPVPIAVIPVFGTIFVAIFALFALGTAIFGVASLHTSHHLRTVGLLLLLLAATWLVLLGASSIYGSLFPSWIDAISFGIISTVTLGIGYALRVSPQFDSTEPEGGVMY